MSASADEFVSLLDVFIIIVLRCRAVFLFSGTNTDPPQGRAGLGAGARGVRFIGRGGAGRGGATGASTAPAESRPGRDGAEDLDSLYLIGRLAGPPLPSHTGSLRSTTSAVAVCAVTAPSRCWRRWRPSQKMILWRSRTPRGRAAP